MSNKPPIARADAKLIAETCADLADRALSWKARALSAEEALRKFAGEIYGRPSRDSDEQPQAENAKRLSPEGVPARAEGIAQPSAPQSSGAHK